MRYYIDLETQRLIDKEGELSDIHFDDSIDFHELCSHLNAKETEKIEYKRKYNNLKFRVKKLTESI